MPHLRLEYSSNIKEKLDVKELFSLCHDILVGTIDAHLSHCQSRAFACDHFHVGDGGANEAFIYLEILFFEGRSLPKLQKMGQQILQLLENYFALSLKELNVRIAVHVVEFASTHYFQTESKIK